MNPDLAGVVRRNALATYLGLVGSIDGAEVTRQGCFTLAAGPGSFSFCNFAASFDCDGTAPGAIASELKSLASERYGFTVFVMTGDRPEGLARALLDAGFERRQRLSSLAANPAAQTAPLDMKQALEMGDRRSVAEFMSGQFFWSMPADARAAIALATALSTHSLWYVGDPGSPEAAVMLVAQADSIGLFNLCVRPELRGKGTGASMVQEVRSLASQPGLPVVLQCARSLVDWYSRQGFHEIGTLEAFTLSDAAYGDILV